MWLLSRTRDILTFRLNRPLSSNTMRLAICFDDLILVMVLTIESHQAAVIGKKQTGI